MPAATPREPELPRGIWLTAGPVRTRIEALLLDLLDPLQFSPLLQDSMIEELGRPVKRTDAVLEYLGLRLLAVDAEGEIPLLVVGPAAARDPWREALLVPGGDCPIGVMLNTWDRGRVAIIHEVFATFSPPQKGLVRRYATLAAAGEPHERIFQRLSEGPDGPRTFAELLTGARREVQLADSSILMSPDGRIRVQLGSLSDTTRNLLREGFEGEQLFILPSTLFEGKTNYSDVEFLVYLNFFVRGRRRTRIVGTGPQQLALKRLLTLTVFGLFDPEAPDQPAFERLRAAFGVPDRETYALLRMAYEMYSVRQRPEPASPIVGIDEYVDFVVLEGEETVVPLRDETPGNAEALGEVRVRPLIQGVDVRIARGGRSVAKRLMPSPPRRRVSPVARELRRVIQFATDRPRFGVTPLGTSHGFDPAGDLTSFVIWLNGKGILVDPSPEALAYLERIGVAPVDLPYVILTHVHADHDGGLLEKILGGGRTTVIASDPVFHSFLEKVRVLTGHDVEREGLVTQLSATPGHPVAIDVGGEPALLETRWNLHPIPTNGFKLSFGGRTFGYSGDTQYDPKLLARLRDAGKLAPAQFDDLMHFFWSPDGTPKVDLLYHEAGIPPIHTDKETLRGLPEAMRSRTFLVHIADREVPEGFSPGKPELFDTQVLLPPSERGRERILLEALQPVAYLHDLPVETLQEILREAEVREYAADEIIIERGPVRKDQPLYFYVVADGRVAVRDGRRMVALLRKGDSFGEWGISHQRGFRIADVVATRRSQAIRFSEAQYWWLIGRHPVVQDRISKIRSFLPRLQLAQTRARLKAQADPSASRSVIASMTANQLSGFAIFSEAREFKLGQPIVVEGQEADGFYILLSGHLIATVGGRLVGELDEGDVFGEMGLLEGGKRAATVTVVSADAEVLSMSRRNFQQLLQAMPIFSWGIRETAALRRASFITE